MAVKFKVETGIQLLSRLGKKVSLENFYPFLFESGPKHGDVIEIFSESSPNFLVNELVAATLIPREIGGLGSAALIFITDGNFEISAFNQLLKHKLHTYQSQKYTEINIKKFDHLLEEALTNLHLLHVYDTSELHITIQNIDSFVTKFPNISLIVFNTLTAFYWSEQSYKVMKMDLYLKQLLKTIQIITRPHKVVIMYIRPQNFSSNKEVEKLEMCCNQPTEERINYRIQITHGDGTNCIVVQTHNNVLKREYSLIDGQLTWAKI